MDIILFNKNENGDDMIKCPNCTGEMKYDPELQKVKCEFCATAFTIEELKEKIKNKIVASDVEDVDNLNEYSFDNSTATTAETYEGKSYKCTQCGATLMTFDDTAVTFCSYCGSQAMLEDKLLKQTNPDYVIPFKKTREECIDAYKRKINSFKFVPKYMKEDVTLEKFRGIYMPYCINNLKKKGQIRNEGEKYSHRRGDYIYYNKYAIKSDVDVAYEGISFDLSSKFYDCYSMSIPYNFKEAVKFDPAYLTGYYADTLDVEKHVYQDVAKEIATPDATKRLRKDNMFRKYGCNLPTISNFDNDFKIGMFPTYFLGVRSKDNQSMHYAIVNGQTGEVAMDLPIDFKKYILVSLIVGLIIFLVLNRFLILKPEYVSIFSVVTAFICLRISSGQFKKIAIKTEHTDDKGIANAKKKSTLKQDSFIKEKKKKKGNFKYTYKLWIAILLPIIAYFTHFAEDMVYYGAAFISLALVLWSFKDLVKEHNLLASNKLPQLEKRGGDLSE